MAKPISCVDMGIGFYFPFYGGNVVSERGNRSHHTMCAFPDKTNDTLDDEALLCLINLCIECAGYIKPIRKNPTYIMDQHKTISSESNWENECVKQISNKSRRS